MDNDWFVLGMLFLLLSTLWGFLYFILKHPDFSIHIKEAKGKKR